MSVYLVREIAYIRMEKNASHTPEQGRSDTPIRTDGFYGVLERVVENAYATDRDPDLTSLFTTGTFVTLSTQEQQEIIAYAIEQGYVTQEQVTKMFASTAFEPEKPEPQMIVKRATAETPKRGDGFYGLIERTAGMQIEMMQQPDLSQIFVIPKFKEFSEDEQKALRQYAVDRGYMTATSDVSVPRNEATSENTPEPAAAERGNGETRGNVDERTKWIEEGLEKLQQRGYILGQSDVIDRMERRHGRIFVGYGAEKDPMSNELVIREAYARKKKGDNYETPTRTTRIQVPEEIRERWLNDAEFRNVVLRGLIYRRDELEGDYDNRGRFKVGTSIQTRGIRDGKLVDEIEAVRQNPSLLKPEWVYQLDGKEHHERMDISDLNAATIEQMIANPKGYYDSQEFKSWYGKALEQKRDEILNAALAKKYATQQPETAVADPDGTKVISRVQMEAAAKRSVSIPETAPDADDDRETGKTVEMELPEELRHESERPKDETREVIVWEADEMFEIARAKINELEPLFQARPNLPLFIEYTLALTSEGLHRKGRKGEPIRTEPARVEILSAVSAAFADYFAEKGAQASDQEAAQLETEDLKVFDTLLRDAVSTVALEAFGGKAKDEKESDARRDVMNYVVKLVTEGTNLQPNAVKLKDIIKVVPGGGFEIPDTNKLKTLLVRFYAGLVGK